MKGSHGKRCVGSSGGLLLVDIMVLINRDVLWFVVTVYNKSQRPEDSGQTTGRKFAYLV